MTPREAELTDRLLRLEERMERTVMLLTSRLEGALAENTRLTVENKLLREKVDRLARRLFGKSSEKLDPGQLELLLRFPPEESLAGKPPASPCQSPEADTWEAKTNPHRPPGSAPRRRPRLPEHLPVEETVIEPDEVLAEPERWRRIGEEVRELLDYRPARFVRLRTVRPKYVLKDIAEPAPLIAPLPPSLQDACLAAPGLIAAIIVGKFCDHLPLYRQEKIFAVRHGVDIPRQTMCRWMALAAFWLRPLYEKIKTAVLDGGYVQVDETPVKYLEPGRGSAPSGYLWTVHRPGGDTFFSWHTGRGASCLESIIPDNWCGTLQTDGYSAYPAFIKGRLQRTGAVITLAGCMAHARRAFHGALHQAQTSCGFILRQMQHLYAIERRLRESGAGPALRSAVRAAQSRPVMKRLHRWCSRLQTLRRHLPRSATGKATAYFLNHWRELCGFLNDGRLMMDNNPVENAIRPTAVGKKNWLFVGHKDAGETGAVLYTLVEYARRRGLDPFTFLRDALTRLPAMKASQVDELLSGVRPECCTAAAR
jgi:transposase